MRTARVIEPIRTIPRELEPVERDSVAQWLLGVGDVPAAEVLRVAGLAPYAYTVLPVKHVLRPSLRPDFLAALRRHHEIKREIIPLLAGWRQVGIDVLLFKGFQLAEFVYPVRGARFHSDVDVLIRPEHAERAAKIARSLRWRHGPAPAASTAAHCTYNLVRVDGATMLDVHRWVLHARLPWARVQERITEAVWRSSRKREWHGIEVREPSPVDSLLVGLALQRCWGDDWRLKPLDVVDFQHLRRRAEVGRRALWSRAQTLRCERTLTLFLERCDPDAQRLDLSRPSRADQRRWNGVAFRERGLLGKAERRLARLLAAPARILIGTAFVSPVLRVRLALRRDGDLRKVLSVLTRTGDCVREASPDEIKRVVSGVRWAMRLVGTGAHGTCLVRSLAIYAILRRQGFPVQFVSGLRRDETSVMGHAWVEHGGAVLWDLREPNNHLIYRENFRFPAELRSEALETADHSGHIRQSTAARPNFEFG